MIIINYYYVKNKNNKKNVSKKENFVSSFTIEF